MSFSFLFHQALHKYIIFSGDLIQYLSLKDTKTQEKSMALTQEEKMLVQEAMNVYLQLLAQQAPQKQVQKIAQIAEGILRKLDSIGSGGGKSGNKPAGITDDWFKNVCSKCDKLSPSGCTDKVTEKFPGKCDPILHYENKKLGLGK
jgi:hypothetical protein